MIAYVIRWSVANRFLILLGTLFIIGAGVCADNASCAISCTGIGEHLLRTSLAKTAALCVALAIDRNAVERRTTHAGRDFQYR